MRQSCRSAWGWGQQSPRLGFKKPANGRSLFNPDFCNKIGQKRSYDY